MSREGGWEDQSKYTVRKYQVWTQESKAEDFCATSFSYVGEAGRELQRQERRQPRRKWTTKVLKMLFGLTLLLTHGSQDACSLGQLQQMCQMRLCVSQASHSLWSPLLTKKPCITYGLGEDTTFLVASFMCNTHEMHFSCELFTFHPHLTFHHYGETTKGAFPPAQDRKVKSSKPDASHITHYANVKHDLTVKWNFPMKRENFRNKNEAWIEKHRQESRERPRAYILG